MVPRFKDMMGSEDGLSKQELFVNGLVKLLSLEFDYNLTPGVLSEDCIRLNIDKCPFRPVKSRSLCSIMSGISASLAFVTFGYCKVVVAQGPDRAPKPCHIDLYIEPSDEALSKTGVEYTKDNIVLLQERDSKFIEGQKIAHRKLMLGLFSSIALSLRKQLSTKELLQNFIESLSCVVGVGAAGIYLKDEARESFILEAYFGLPQDIIYSIREIDDKNHPISRGDKETIPLADGFGWNDLSISKLSRIRSFTSIKIKSENRVLGLLNIGWKSTLPLGPESRESLRDACDLLAAAIDNSRIYHELEKSYIDSIGIINNLVNVVDSFSKDHANNVAELSEAIAIEIGLSQDEARLLYQAGFVHDIGKINIPAEILNKTGELTEEEFEKIKEHPIIGANMLSPISAFKGIVPAVKYHHERLDGSGYPEGLMGDQMPLYARIVAVADVYDAILSARSYREARQKEEAISELVNGKGTKYDPDVVDALISIVKARVKSF